MRIQQYIFVGVLTIALVVGCIKAGRKIIGGVIEGFSGFVIPFSLGAIYVWRGGNPMAADPDEMSVKD